STAQRPSSARASSPQEMLSQSSPSSLQSTLPPTSESPHASHRACVPGAFAEPQPTTRSYSGSIDTACPPTHPHAPPLASSSTVPCPRSAKPEESHPESPPRSRSNAPGPAIFAALARLRMHSSNANSLRELSLI